MRTRLLLVGLVLLLAPSAAWAQAQLTTSYAQFQNNENHLEAQLIRCDVSGGIAGDGVIGGETCVSGDWSKPLDCRDKLNVGIRFFEYGGGSGIAKIWDCQHIPDGPPAAPSTAGGSVPGTEAPAGTPSPADPDPLCVSLDDAAGVSIVGTAATVQMLNFSDQKFHFIVGEIDDCTGNCDSTLIVSCGR